MFPRKSGGGDVIDETRLPEAAREADAILHVAIVDGEYTDWVYQPERSEAQAEAAQRRFDRLSRRPPSAGDEETDDGDEV